MPIGGMIEDTEAQPLVQSVGNRGAKSSQPAPPGAPGGGSTVDEMSEWSFPASDPPAVWTWEPKAPRLNPTESPARQGVPGSMRDDGERAD
jgi:hypothetical protein